MLSRLRSSVTGSSHKPSESVRDEAACVEKLRDELLADSTLDGKQLAWLDNACLLRYVRATKCQHDAAVSRIRETLRWRKDVGVDRLLPASTSPEFPMLRDEAACGKMFVLPAPDKQGRSVIIMRPGLQVAENPESNIRYLIYTLERAARVSESVAGGESKYIVIVDYSAGEFSLRRSPSLATSKATLHIMQDHFPERLSHAFLFDAPAIFSPVFRILKPFIDPVTFAKIHFISQATAATDPVCVSVLDQDAIPVEYGGKLNYHFNVDEYFRQL